MVKFVLNFLPIIPLLLVGIILLILRRFLLLPVIIGGIFSFILWFWRFLFKPPFGLQSQLTIETREKIIPDIQKASNSITTLSSGAILLTFSIIRVLGKQFSYKHFLIFSWYGFGFCIVFGVIIAILAYIFRAHYFTMIGALKNLGDEEIRKKFKSLVDRTFNLEKVLFVFAFLQPMIFFISMLYVILFAVRNI